MQGTLGTPSGDYWLGLNSISALSQTGKFQLVVKFMTASDSANYQVSYTTFTVGDASTGYQLTIGGFSGNFTFDAFQGYNGYKFTTADNKNDNTPSGTNCAVNDAGAWWYGNDCQCSACLTQGGLFVWALGFTSFNLASDSMSLVCI